VGEKKEHGKLKEEKESQRECSRGKASTIITGKGSRGSQIVWGGYKQEKGRVERGGWRERTLTVKKKDMVCSLLLKTQSSKEKIRGFRMEKGGVGEGITSNRKKGRKTI